jgi:hypothetical protein
MEEMKKEVLQLQKDLLQEKAKVKSLKTELENPLNVHRWRKLEGNDPPTLELINKIQSLQVEGSFKYCKKRNGIKLSSCTTSSTKYNHKDGRLSLQNVTQIASEMLKFVMISSLLKLNV